MYYIIIRGPLGSGKTTIAKELSKKLREKYISVDEHLENNGLDKVEGKSIPVKSFLKVNRMVAPEAKKGLIKSMVVIFDGNFYHKNQIKDLIKIMKIPHYVFTLKASLETCIKRDDGRKRKYGVRSVKAVYNLVKKFDYGIEIDTENKTSKGVAKESVQYLPRR